MLPLHLTKINFNTFKPKGFTLVELLVVVALMAILALMAVPVFDQYQKENRRIAAQTMLVDIMAKYNQQAYIAGANTFINAQKPDFSRPYLQQWNTSLNNIQAYSNILKADSIPFYKLIVNNQFVYNSSYDTNYTFPLIDYTHYNTQFVIIAQPIGQQSGDGELCINNYGDHSWNPTGTCKLLLTTPVSSDALMQSYTWFGE